MNQQQRNAKRAKRENRPDKGVSSEAKRQAKQARLRKARERFNLSDIPDAGMSLLALALLGKRKK